MNHSTKTPSTEEADTHEDEVTIDVEAYFLMDTAGSLLGPLTDFGATAIEPYAAIARAYCASVDGLMSTVMMGFEIARRAVTLQRHQQLAMARELELALEGSIEMKDVRQLATNDAWREVGSHWRDPEIKQSLLNQAKGFLELMLRNPPIQRAAEELLRQSLVLCWSALEVLAKDTFATFLNQNPSSIERLLREPTASRRFDIARIPLQTLSDYGFDLSDKMGTLALTYQDLSDLNSIKATLFALFGTPELRSGLNDADVRLLGQERNLIVHRCGIVDREFVKNAGCSQSIGEHLQVTCEVLMRRAAAAAKACFAILHAASSNATQSA